MYSRILHDLLICSITGSIMLFMSMAARMLLKRHSADQHMMLLVSLIMFMIPISSLFAVPKTVVIEVHDSSPVQPIIYGTQAEGSMDTARLIFAVWAVISVLLVVKNIVSYIKLANEVYRCPVIDDRRIQNIFDSSVRRAGIKRRVILKSSGELISPVLFGVIRPALILPEREFNARELEMIITHELTHCRHFDTVFKIMSVAVSCVHWFNPAVYILRKRIGESCELWCDETVLRSLNISDKKEYGRLLLSVMETGSKITSYSTSMAASKRQLKKRLKKVIQYREATRAAKAVGMITAAALSVCSVTAFGFSKAAEIAPENLSEVFSPVSEQPERNETVKSEQPKETEIPQPDKTEAVPSPVPVQEVTEPTYTAMATEPEQVEDQTEQPEIERQSSYTFMIDEETTEPTDEESGLLLEKGSGYVLNADAGSIYSMVMTAAEDMQLVIRSDAGSVTLTHNGKAAEAESFLLDAARGDIYEMQLDSADGGKIYINCR